MNRRRFRIICTARLGRAVAETLGVLGLALTLAACGGSSSGPTDPARITSAEVELHSFQLVNSARQDQGVQPQLGLDEIVGSVARSHSESMRDEAFFGHVDRNGNTVGDRLRQAGVSFSKAAENLIRLSDSGNPAVEAHSTMMASQPHRDHILDPSFQLVGVGVALRGDTYWLTQIFIRQ